MNEKQKIEYLITRIDQATKAGVFNLQEATNSGIILRDLVSDFEKKNAMQSKKQSLESKKSDENLTQKTTAKSNKPNKAI